MTLSRIRLKAWVSNGPASGYAWEDRLSELADYRKIGHCNVPELHENKLARWVSKKVQFRLHASKERGHQL
jgi:hypothetical protein